MVVEASDSEQVEHLLVHFLLGIDDVENHLLRIGSDGRHIEGEIDARLVGRARDVHQTIHADVVRGERLAELQVGQWHADDGVEGLQVECGIVGVATEDDAATLRELKIFLNDVLDGEFVDAVIDVVVAEHIERALVVVGRTNHAVAVERNVVARRRVHNHLQRGPRIRVDEEIQANVGALFGHFFLGVGCWVLGDEALKLDF